jgi:chromosome segregation ATPase
MVEQASTGNVETTGGERPGGSNRNVIVALVIGACGVVVAIVALIIAISANHTTNDNAKIAKAVRAAETQQISGVRADLQRNVAAATVLLRRLQSSSARAHRADAKLHHDVNADKAAVSSNRSQIAVNRSRIDTADANISHLQTTVGGLNANVKNLTATVKSQQQAQQALAQRVKRLQREVNNLP